MRRGEKTAYPGVFRVDGEYLVRVSVKDAAGCTDRERWVEGDLAAAVHARELLRAEVRKEREYEVRQRALGIHVDVRRETVAEYAKRWVTHLVRSGRNRKHVIEQRIQVLNTFILPSLGRTELRHVTRRHLVAWLEELGDRKQDDGEAYAVATLEGVWAVVRTMMKDALVLADLPSDPTYGVRCHVRGNEPVEKAVLTRDELARLLAESEHESPDMRAMIWVGFTTGMRFGELSALQWRDVDFDVGLIHVRRSQVGGNVGPTKTRSRRTVPLHSVVADILRAHKRWQDERQLERNPLGFLFLPNRPRLMGPDGEPRRTQALRFSATLSKPLARCAERARVKKHVSTHTMRRTFNNLARQAAGEIVARSMTGHSSTAMTEHYSHVSLEEKAKAIESALGLLTTKTAGES